MRQGIPKQILPLLAALFPFTAPGASTTNPVTVEFTQGRRGYHGMQGVWLAQHRPDHGINRDDWIVGWTGNNPDEELRGLVNFTGLDIPEGSNIQSAELSFLCHQIYQKPAVEVYGLLHDFFPSRHEWAEANPGETTWNHRRHGSEPWREAGAEAPGAAGDFGGTGDRAPEPDDSAIIAEQGRIAFDVTRSFRRQFEAGKSCGWLLKAPKTRVQSYAVFNKAKARLEVTFEPPEDVFYPAWSLSGPHLISFDLGKAIDIARDPSRVRDLPFEGSTFWGVPNGDGPRFLCNSVMGPDPIDAADYSEFLEAMKTVAREPSPLQHNFLRVNLCVPGTLEKGEEPYTWHTRPMGNDKVTMWWSDGFETIVKNVETAASIAKQAGMKGLFVALEPFGGDIWSFEQLKDAEELGKSIGETRAQVRKRAGEFVGGINRVYPDMTMIVTFYLYTEQDYLLWNDFCDGMIAGADPRMKIVNGTERGYSCVSRKEFEKLYEWHYRDFLPYCSVPDKYLRQTEMAFGVYFNSMGWGPDPELITSSALWQTKLEHALAITDRYVWIFTGGGEALQPNWLTREHIPQAYLDATRLGLELARRRRMVDDGRTE